MSKGWFVFWTLWCFGFGLLSFYWAATAKTEWNFILQIVCATIDFVCGFVNLRWVLET